MIPKYTTAQAAELIGVHPETIKKAIAAKKLTASKIGKGYKMTDANIQVYINSKTLYASSKR